MTARDRHVTDVLGYPKKADVDVWSKTSQDVSYMTSWDETELNTLTNLRVLFFPHISKYNIFKNVKYFPHTLVV